MATQAKRDYYEILSVTRTATEQEIKSSFQKLAADYQAKGIPANIDAVERFREIARAYRILSDADQRRRYDQFGESGIVFQPVASGYDLDELEQRANFGGRYQWPTTDPALAKILDKLIDWD
ncbi:MAG TPA: DnaJ domain-containing protein [Candidatus Acidoferrum sp.]|nr:DnaJ domain-containing protein [Candidatus Acidoferrum sp.]